VDWDVHHGNGTQEVFYEDPTVFYFSIHRWPFYPGTGSERETGAGAGEGFTRNIPVRYGTPPETTLRRFEAAVREIAHSFRPDLTIVSAGFDAYRDDPIGGLDLLPEHFAAMTDAVVRETGKGVVSLLEGGYALDALGRLAEAHVARLATASAAG
jgi:acetoin utilization deacetylase AcuC-like enzyme